MRTHPWQPAGKVVGSPKIRFDLHVRHDTPGTKEERSLLKIRANLPGENFEHRGPTPGPVCVSNVVAKFDGQIFSALEGSQFCFGGSGGVSPLVARGGATLLMAGTCPWQERRSERALLAHGAPRVNTAARGAAEHGPHTVPAFSEVLPRVNHFVFR